MLLDIGEAFGNRNRQEHQHVLVLINLLDKAVQYEHAVNQTDPHHHENPNYQVTQQTLFKSRHQFLLFLQDQHCQILVSCRNDRESNIIIVRKVLLEIGLLSPHSNVSKNQKSAVLGQQW